jgi:hypothetical protein
MKKQITLKLTKTPKASCKGRSGGCFITLLPTLIRKENLEQFKKAA